MSNVTITGMSIPNTQIPLGPDKTGVCGVTNNSSIVTFATALSRVYRGKGGFLIKLHTTIHYVSHVAADGLSLTTTTNYVGSTDASAAYIIYPCLELRFYCDTPFQPVGASYVVQASPIGSPNFFKSALVSQYDAGTGDLLWMPDIVLPATGDIASPPQQKAKYFPVFYTLQGNQVAFLGGFEKGLRVPETPSSTNWPDLLVAQQTQPYNFLNEASTLSSDQVLALISSAAAIDGTPRTLLMAASGGVAAEDSALSQDVSGNLIAAGNLTLGSDLAVVDDATIGGTVTAADATISGALAAGSAAVTGAVTAASATLSGALNSNTAAVTGAVTAASAALSGALTSASATVSGAVAAGSAAVTAALTVGTTATVTGETDLIGGFKTRTAAQVAGLTAGNYGRLTWQTDALKGWKKDYGASVGIRHAQPFYDAYEIGLVPNSSGSASANQTAWDAFHTAAPDAGAILRLPEGEFYLTTGMACTKPIQIIGAGANFWNTVGPQKAGTTLIVSNGASGITFTGQVVAKGGRVQDLNIQTVSGYSGQTTGYGIWADCTVTIENVSVNGFAIDGIHLAGTVASSQNSDLSRITSVHVFDVKRDGIHLDGGGDSNVITVLNPNVTRAGRHGIYDAGTNNTWINAHINGSAIVTAGSHDYQIAGSSGVHINPYSETTGSEQFYFATGAVGVTVFAGFSGVPTFDGPMILDNHFILERGHLRDVNIRDTTNSGSGHDYRLYSRSGALWAGGLQLQDLTASKIVYSYEPAAERTYLPNVGIDGVLRMTGTPQTLTGPGSINLTTHTTLVVTTGADALTLAAGAEGQFKFIRLKTDGGDATITVTNLEGATTIVMDSAGQSVYLLYQDAKWNVLANNGCTIT